MQFQVPQFIEVEDKIFGPLTFKQFIYMGGGAGACYLLWRLLPLYIAAPFIVIVGGLAAALAFFQFNGRPFILALESGFYFLLRSKLYLWNNARKKAAAPAVAAQTPEMRGEVYVPKLSGSKLHEMAWSLDIKDRVAAGLETTPESHVFRSERDIVAPLRTPQQILRRFGEEAAA